MEKNSSVTSELESRLEDIFGGDEDSTLIKDDIAFDNAALNDLKAVVLSIDWEITDEIMDRFIDQIDHLKESYNKDKVVILFFQLLRSVGKYIKNNKSDAHPDATRLLNSTYNSLEKILLNNDMTNQQKEKILLGEIKKFKMLKKEIAAKKIGRMHQGKKQIIEEVPIMEKETQMDIDIEASPGPSIIEHPESSPEIEFDQKDYDDEEDGEELFIHPKIKTEKEVKRKEKSKTESPQTPAMETEAGTIRLEPSKLHPHEAFAIALEEIKQVIKTEFQALRAELKLWREE